MMAAEAEAVKRVEELLAEKTADYDDVVKLRKAGKIAEDGSGVLKFNNWDDMKEAYKGTITQFVKENKPKYSPDIYRR